MKTLFTLLFAAMLATATSIAADGPVRHVVSFKFKKDADPAAIAKVEKDFAALEVQIPFVETLEFGKNISKEGHDKGFTHIWIATFKNEADRDAYLVHPAHKAFVATLEAVMEDAFVVDFIPTK